MRVSLISGIRTLDPPPSGYGLEEQVDIINFGGVIDPIAEYLLVTGMLTGAELGSRTKSPATKSSMDKNPAAKNSATFYIRMNCFNMNLLLHI